MEVLLQEARDSYDGEIVVELTSNTSDDMESNIERVEQWIEQWKKDSVQNAQ
jgi:broad-specificity NMP kinase